MSIELQLVIASWFLMVAIVMLSATLYHLWIKKGYKAEISISPRPWVEIELGLSNAKIKRKI